MAQVLGMLVRAEEGAEVRGVRITGVNYWDGKPVITVPKGGTLRNVAIRVNENREVTIEPNPEGKEENFVFGWIE